MLSITMKVGEAVIIDSDIRIEVISIEGGQIRLGIEAPDAILILREELLSEERLGVSD